MLDIKKMLPELKKLVTDLSEDLLARSTAKNDPYSAEVDAGLREAYTQIEKGGRTADAFEVWREDYLDQVAVAWVLGCVFVRFMEDNHLIDECWLAGEGDRRKLAEDTHELYFREHPHESDREYFEHVFHEVGKIPACRDLFAEGKTPLWAVGPSGDAAMKLLAFWRDPVPETGKLRRSFDVEDGDTRFLGDLYQDLSERARKKYALLQTPVFVEEFILNRTLDPAIDEFGLDEVRMIDPTCGSGHFLLGGFARLFDLWIKREDNEVMAAQKALDGVWGCDINPFAVAIARFRLIVAALRACGSKRLKNAPAWNIHLATGDSLLFGNRWTRGGQKESEQQFLGTEEESWAPEIYGCEDKEAISEVLGQQYHAVVGNPPYITVKDAALNAAYRSRWSTCYQQYSLAVPFTQRLFDLAYGTKSSRAGYVGTITASSFMKRVFGKALVEKFFPRVNLTHLIDTSGAYIPGHGTPTVILFGRNSPPFTDDIRVVAGIKGEPGTPSVPSEGLVWRSITSQIDTPGSEDSFNSVDDVKRTAFTTHPWTLRGGGASEAKGMLEAAASRTLGSLSSSIGRTSVVGEDECWLVDHGVAERNGIAAFAVPFAVGDRIRDWHMETLPVAIYPYDKLGGYPLPDLPPAVHIWLWPFRSLLSGRKVFGKTMAAQGKKWYEHLEHYRSKFSPPYSIAFAFVATHNHFVFDEGGKLFNRSAPIIKLAGDYSEEEYVSLLGILNSSAVCFWMKQTFHNMGSTVDQHGARQRTEAFEDFYQHMGTGLKQLPIPDSLPIETSSRLSKLGCELQAESAEALVQQEVPVLARLQASGVAFARCLARMIALQEELDWECYRLYGILDEDLCCHGDELPNIELGQRAFEIVMAQQMRSGECETTWFERHGSRLVTEIPSHWPKAYQKVVERRIELIEQNKEIGLIEKPEFKRRWNTESWRDQQQRALWNWLLDRLGSQHYWLDAEQYEPRLQSVAELSDKASGDQDFLRVATIYRNRQDFDVAAFVTELVESESVPLLPILRYKPSGLRKRDVWQETWELQRKQDDGEKVGQIKSPPKYATKDFQRSDYWRLRGKLDVPKERWISFPHCQTESDPSLVIGWAGWNHLQQATALIAYYDARKREGWDAKRLTPLLAGLDQLLPWIHQWHSEVDPEFGETAGQSFETMLKADAHELGLTLDEIRAWEPPAKTRGRQPRKAPKTRKKKEAVDADKKANHQ